MRREPLAYTASRPAHVPGYETQSTGVTKRVGPRPTWWYDPTDYAGAEGMNA